jgi:hypothetical protein
MKKINKINKDGPIVYNAKVHELLAEKTDELPTFSDSDQDWISQNYGIIQVLAVLIGFNSDGYLDDSAFVFHFGKEYGAIMAWCKNGCDEEHNKPLEKLWDEYWNERYPNEDLESKFTTAKLWEILTGFISHEQKFSPFV